MLHSGNSIKKNSNKDTNLGYLWVSEKVSKEKTSFSTNISKPKIRTLNQPYILNTNYFVTKLTTSLVTPVNNITLTTFKETALT